VPAPAGAKAAGGPASTTAATPQGVQPPQTPSPAKQTAAPTARKPQDILLSIPDQVDQYLVISQAACVTLEQRVLAIDAFQKAVASVREAGSSVSGVASKLESQVKKHQKAEQKVHGLFDQLQAVKERIVLGQSDDASKGADLGKLVKQAQAAFPKIDAAQKEVDHLGRESFRACFDAEHATVLGALHPLSREGKERLERIKNVAGALKTCTECQSDLAQLPPELGGGTIEVCQRAVKSLVDMLTKAAPKGRAPVAPKTGAGSWTSAPSRQGP
jgi:hypothetical protein